LGLAGDEGRHVAWDVGHGRGVETDVDVDDDGDARGP
jgi:hypothetical protein